MKLNRRQLRSIIQEELMLDKETSHGGWPDGPSKSFTSSEPVNKQIAKWLRDMKMVKK
jgi:hypothetical protein